MIHIIECGFQQMIDLIYSTFRALSLSVTFRNHNLDWPSLGLSVALCGFPPLQRPFTHIKSCISCCCLIPTAFLFQLPCLLSPSTLLSSPTAHFFPALFLRGLGIQEPPLLLAPPSLGQSSSCEFGSTTTAKNKKQLAPQPNHEEAGG